MAHNILYIEDNPDNVALVRRALEARGHKIMHAANGTRGVVMAEREKPSLILLDINLPDIDGYEVARRLRSNGKRDIASTPIIVITANALKGDAQKAMDAGANMYMSKPINIRELWAKVEAFTSR